MIIASDKLKRLEKEVQEVAREGILLLEKEAARRFGIEFRIGVELEGWAISDLFEYGSPIDTRKISSLFSDVAVGESIVKSFIKESGMDRLHKKYEFITNVLSPIEAAMAAKKIKDLAVREAANYGLDGFSFDDFQENVMSRYRTAGMHINISLWRNEEPLFLVESRGPIVFSDLMTHASNWKSLLVQRDAFFCVVMNDNGFKRLEEGGAVLPNSISAAAMVMGQSMALRHSTKRRGGRPFLKPEEVRIENRLPGASANPFLAVLTTMASIYAGIKDFVDVSAADELLVEEEIRGSLSLKKYYFPPDPQSALRIFMREDSSFRNLLDSLLPEKNLGTRLVDKVVEYAAARYQITPPGKQEMGVSR